MHPSTPYPLPLFSDACDHWLARPRSLPPQPDRRLTRLQGSISAPSIAPPSPQGEDTSRSRHLHYTNMQDTQAYAVTIRRSRFEGLYFCRRIVSLVRAVMHSRHSGRKTVEVESAKTWTTTPSVGETTTPSVGDLFDQHKHSHPGELFVPIRLVPCEDFQAAPVTCSLQALVGRNEEAVVVLDGLLNEQTRAAILSLLRGADSPGTLRTAPPNDRWKRNAVDSCRGPPSYGLRQDLLKEFRLTPPDCILTVQSRLAALYPEYDICHMPEFGETAGEQMLRTSFVANAAGGYAPSYARSPVH